MTQARADIVVLIPAETGSVHVLRTVVAGTAARAGFSYDEIEDLRLAVHEAAARLLADVPNSERLELSIERLGEGLDLVVAADGAADPWPVEGLERSLTWQVLPALVDEAEPRRAELGPAFRLRKRPAGTG